MVETAITLYSVITLNTSLDNVHKGLLNAFVFDLAVLQCKKDTRMIHL
jgi:hypothetical protein